MKLRAASLAKLQTRNKKPFRITRNGIIKPRRIDHARLGFKGFAAAAALARVRIADFETAAI